MPRRKPRISPGRIPPPPPITDASRAGARRRGLTTLALRGVHRLTMQDMQQPFSCPTCQTGSTTRGVCPKRCQTEQGRPQMLQPNYVTASYGPGPVTVTGDIAEALREQERRIGEYETRFADRSAHIVMGGNRPGKVTSRPVPYETFDATWVSPGAHETMASALTTWAPIERDAQGLVT